MEKKKEKNRKPLIVLIIILVAVGGLFLYYQNNLKPDANSEYIGTWGSNKYEYKDGTIEYQYGDERYDDFFTLNEDGTCLESFYGESIKDVWTETDEYIFIVKAEERLYKDDGKLVSDLYDDGSRAVYDKLS